jgi:hypothetical protein
MLSALQDQVQPPAYGSDINSLEKAMAAKHVDSTREAIAAADQCVAALRLAGLDRASAHVARHRRGQHRGEVRLRIHWWRTVPAGRRDPYVATRALPPVSTSSRTLIRLAV